MSKRRILDVHVDWMNDWHNPPGLRILFNDITFEGKYRRKANYYYAEDRGLARFFAYSGPGEGYGGCTFVIPMEDGTTKELIGPWSGNRTGVKELGFGEVFNAAITDDPKVMDHGCAFLSGAVTEDVFTEAIKFYNGKHPDAPIQSVSDTIYGKLPVAVTAAGEIIGKPSDPSWWQAYRRE